MRLIIKTRELQGTVSNIKGTMHIYRDDDELQVGYLKNGDNTVCTVTVYKQQDITAVKVHVGKTLCKEEYENGEYAMDLMDKVDYEEQQIAEQLRDSDYGDDEMERVLQFYKQYPERWQTIPEEPDLIINQQAVIIYVVNKVVVVPEIRNGEEFIKVNGKIKHVRRITDCLFN